MQIKYRFYYLTGTPVVGATGLDVYSWRSSSKNILAYSYGEALHKLVISAVQRIGENVKIRIFQAFQTADLKATPQDRLKWMELSVASETLACFVPLVDQDKVCGLEGDKDLTTSGVSE